MAKIRIVNKKNQDDLQAKRNVLFEQFCSNPQEIHLALEIKSLDDKIAKLRFQNCAARVIESTTQSHEAP